MRAGCTTRHWIWLFLLLASWHLSLTLTPACGAEPAPTAEDRAVAPPAAVEPSSPPPDDALAAAARLLQALREQQEANQRTIERLREQQQAAHHQAEVTAARLKLIEMTLSDRHERELAALQASHRLTQTVVLAGAGIGVVALGILAFFLFRATNRLAELPQTLAPLAAAAPAPGRFLLAGTTSAEANARLLSMVGLLEKKFGDLEHAVEAPAPAPTKAPAPAANGSTRGADAGTGRVPNLLARGQSLLEDEAGAEEALRVFDEVVALDPGNTTALLKRGKALEKLGRLEEALRSYDRALAIDSSLTIAHLSKGGVFNRLDRFGEALECYERALQTQAPQTAPARS